MGKSKDLATGETRFVNTAGDTMTGNLGIGIGSDSAQGALDVRGAIVTSNSTTSYWKLDRDDSTGSFTINDTGANNRMLIDTSGRVTIPNQPSFAAGVSHNNWTTSSATDAPFDTEIFDIGNNYNTSNYTFTAPVAGRYFASIFLNRYTNSRFDIAFNVNGTNRHIAEIRISFSSDNWKIESFQTILNLAANDAVKARITGVSSQGSAFFDGNGTSYDVFSMHLLG